MKWNALLEDFSLLRSVNIKALFQFSKLINPLAASWVDFFISHLTLMFGCVSAVGKFIKILFSLSKSQPHRVYPFLYRGVIWSRITLGIFTAFVLHSRIWSLSILECARKNTVQLCGWEKYQEKCNMMSTKYCVSVLILFWGCIDEKLLCWHGNPSDAFILNEMKEFFAL